MENYISKCLDSLIVPSIDKLDIIVVNDGSKDRSSEIAHSYANKFPNSIRVIDKENGNYGSCINAALPTLKGKYVKILDADDTFDSNNLEKFIRKITKINIDCIITNYKEINSRGWTIKKINYNFLTQNKEFNLDNINLITYINKIAMHAITYNSSIFINKNYIQTEKISYTDTEWIWLPMSWCKTYIYIPYYIYNYLLGRPGQTVNFEIDRRNINHHIIRFERQISYLYNRSKDLKENINVYKNKFLEISLLIYIYRLYKRYLIQEKDSSTEALINFDKKNYIFINYLEKNYNIIFENDKEYLNKLNLWRQGSYNNSLLFKKNIFHKVKNYIKKFLISI